MRAKTVEAQIPPGTFESTEEKFRQKYAELGADRAYFLMEFLRGFRALEVQPSEIVKTLLYQRSSEAEKRALEFVCSSDAERHPSPDSENKIRERDQFIIDFVDGRVLGHSDLVQQLTSIPARVAERARFDSKLFQTVYPSPKLFSWIWGAR